ncbi:MAG: FAD-linked oxidase C-terminal domain-containing protein [Candidatus Hadarchaeum sp.]|uniref:FAD-binding oxidoreductase n=1 Tax=Candidatus Hadarchaeum sp. TaxID=2883567 RepID=UPI00316D98E1
MQFNLVTPRIIEHLKRIVGEEHVLTSSEDLARYALDEIEERYRSLPEVVVKPRAPEEIAAIMRLANEERIPVTPRGAGTGLSGGAVPIYGGIVLSLERMNQILEIDVDNMMVTVEPGVVLGDMMRAVEAEGLFYPVDVSTLESCHVGGNVAENAGGARAVKYGLTGHWVYGLEIVTPTGEILRLGGKRIKDVTGYNLIQLLVGSEGTLGIITKITFRLTAKPKYVLDLLIPFDSLENAVTQVLEVLLEEINLSAIEFMDSLSIRAVERYLNLRLPHDESEAHLLIQVDGMEEDVVWRTGERVYQKLVRAGAKEVFVADNRLTRERMWRARREIAQALKALYKCVSVEDIVVPRAQIAEAVHYIRQLSYRHRLEVPIYGHIGDGNLHPTPVSNERDEETWIHDLDAFLLEMFRIVCDLGGNLTAEHGVGLKRIKYLPLVMNKAEIALMQAIKRAWDPNGILNPGKAVPLDSVL